LGALVLAAAVAPFLVGLALGARLKGAKRAALALVCVAATGWGRTRSGTDNTTAVSPGSPVHEVVSHHGVPAEIHALPGGATLLSYWIHEHTSIAIAGSERLSSIAYLLDPLGRVQGDGAATTAEAQYYGLPFYELAHAPRATEAHLAWIAALACLSLAAGVRVRRLAGRRAAASPEKA
jgi:hypothetical protein